MDLVTPQAAAKHELLFNMQASGPDVEPTQVVLSKERFGANIRLEANFIEFFTTVSYKFLYKARALVPGKLF
jgi:hypothetical protein